MLRKTEIRIELKCPDCGFHSRLHTPLSGLSESFTADCLECNATLLVEGGLVYLLHEKLHEECPEWPKDGKGTGYIEL